MNHINCWQFIKCGREEDCPAPNFERANGFIDGENAGRSCVYIENTICKNENNLSLSEKFRSLCSKCDFYNLLKVESNGNLDYLQFLEYVKQNKT